VAVGVPAKIVKTLDKDKFEEWFNSNLFN
jgi:hypothetical protein